MPVLDIERMRLQLFLSFHTYTVLPMSMKTRHLQAYVEVSVVFSERRKKG